MRLKGAWLLYNQLYDIVNYRAALLLTAHFACTDQEEMQALKAALIKVSATFAKEITYTSYHGYDLKLRTLWVELWCLDERQKQG